MSTWRQNDRGERGAAAVIVGIMAVLLLITSALAVDLGNAWARKRAVQRQVDVAALAAAYRLPVTTAADRTAIANAVVASMKLSDNAVVGQTLTSLTGSQMLTQGLITFQDNNGASCNVNSLCTQMTVKAPAAHVDFGLAGIMGASGVNVSRAAVVRIESELPDMRDVMPFWLPNGCSFGPAQPDTTQNGPNPRPAPQWAVGAASVAGALPAAALPPPTGQHRINTINYTVPVNSVTQQLSYTITQMEKKHEAGLVRFISPDGSTFVDAAVSDTDGNKNDYMITTGPFTIPAQVVATPGIWTVWGYVLEGPGGNAVLKYSANNLTVTVVGTAPTTATPTPTTATPTTSTASPTGTGSPSPSTSTATPTPTPSSTATGIPVGCTGQDRGNFGQLLSPRKDESNLNTAFGYNISAGLDHQLVPYEFSSVAAEKTACEDIPVTENPVYNDDTPVDGRNCIEPGPGNDGPKIFDGLISGINATYTGRLNTDQAAPSTTCPNGSQTRSDTQIRGNNVNNDVLSCYLRNGASLGQISQPTGVTELMLDGSVTKSPRFIWLPVVYANDRTVKTFQPIKTFVPAFITDEHLDEFGNLVAASADNGLQINGNSVKTLTVFTFNPDALPPQERSPSIAYDPDIGNPIPRLVG